MARIRTVKPELPQDAKLARVSREVRYHFVLLWTVADDAGYFRASPRSMLGQLYPHDLDVTAADVERMGRELAELGLVAFSETPDGPLGFVCNWQRHQRIDRPSKSHLAELFAQHSRDRRDGSAHGVLSPESLVQSPELEDDDDLGGDAVRVPSEPELTALYLAICANKAVTEKWGEQPNPYTPASAASLYAVLRSAGVPPEVARLSFYRQCRDNPQDKPPRSINYFRPGIEQDWQVEQTRRAVAANGDVAPAVIPFRPRNARPNKLEEGRANLAAAIERRAKTRTDHGE